MAQVSLGHTTGGEMSTFTKRSKAEAGKAAAQGHSTFGQKWKDFVASKGGEAAWAAEAKGQLGESGCPLFDQYGFPIVQIAVKISKIISITATENKYQCEFTIMQDWVDPSLGGLTAKKQEEEGTVVDWDLHYQPVLDFQNAVEAPTIMGNNDEMPAPRLRKKENYVTRTVKYIGEFFAKFDFHEFPFDSQVLEIGIEARSFDSRGPKNERRFPTLSDPVEFRQKDGHVIAADSDWLAEWKPVETFNCVQTPPDVQRQRKRCVATLRPNPEAHFPLGCSAISANTTGW